MKARTQAEYAILAGQGILVLGVGLLFAVGVNGILSTTIVESTPSFGAPATDEAEDGEETAQQGSDNLLKYNRNLFNPNALVDDVGLTAEGGTDVDTAADESGDVEVDLILPDGNRPVESDLGHELLGTMVAVPAAGSVAHLRTAQNEDLYVHHGDAIPGGRIARISREYILILNDDRPNGPIEYLSLYGKPGAKKGRGERVASTSSSRRDARAAAVSGTVTPKPRMAPSAAKIAPDRELAQSGGGVRQLGENHFAVDRGLLERQRELDGRLEGALNLETLSEGGEVQGVRLGQVNQGNMFGDVGLKEGDVIKSVNGQTLGSAEDAERMLESLQKQGAVKIRIDRRGVESDLVLEAK